jgi:hypothetical protein
MAALPPPKDGVPQRIDAWHESQQEQPRPHMGCSLLGHHCGRWMWLSFRQAVVERFPGRILRLFRRGHREEGVVAEDLRNAGMEVRDAQARVDFGSHVSGSLDGIIESGVPEAPKKRHVLEIKTHSRKSFDALVKDGVQKSKPQHWAQCQAYMLGSVIDRTLYVAVCKDDDRIYVERIRLEKQKAKYYVERGQEIALSDRMPPPISEDPTWYQCKFCAAHSFCHETRETEQVNCRTCAHSTPTPESTWTCALHGNAEIPEDWQRKGCDGHVAHPDLVPWRLVPDESTDEAACYEVEGKRVMNGRGFVPTSALLRKAHAAT